MERSRDANHADNEMTLAFEDFLNRGPDPTMATMSKVYVVRPDGTTKAMARVHCRDEDKELQRVLENNPDLLPGDQIDPEDPCRWLLIRREMPVPDPNTGNSRWNIDFFFVDQGAIPTFVECKRFMDTRSRREVVGQMLEYAANGHYYWTKEDIHNFAKQTPRPNGQTLDEAFKALHVTNDDDDLDTFFNRVQDNLREGRLRIIFFLEESPMELRSVVDFLNKQMELSWVLLVEARLYTLDGLTVVAPTLFGYTEEARRAKRPVTASTPRRKWDRDSFFDDAKAKLTDDQLQSEKNLYDESTALGFEITWGTGTNNGSFNIKQPSVCSRSLLTVWSNGILQINFGWLNGTEEAADGRERLRDSLVQGGFSIPDEYQSRYLQYSASEWMPKSTQLLQALRAVASDLRAKGATPSS